MSPTCAARPLRSRFPAFGEGGFTASPPHATSWAPSRLIGHGAHPQERLIIGGYRLSSRGSLCEVLLGRKTKKGLRYHSTARAFAGTPLRKQLLSHLRMLHIYDCPFLRSFETIPEGMTEEQMEDCIWVEPSTRVWVACGPRSENGRLSAPAILQRAD